MAVLLVALLHLYLGARLLPPLASPWDWVGGVALAALFVLLLAGWRRMVGAHKSSGVLAWAGSIALGLFSSLFVLTLLRDAVLLVAWPFGGLDASARETSALVVIGLAMGATLLGLANARRRPAVRRIDVPITDLPAALHGFSIVQISDLHVGPTIRRGFVERVVETANALQADVIAITGDTVDGSVAELAEHTAPLAGLRARHGVYAVTGNHEYYAGVRPWLAEFERLGARTLLNEHVVFERGGARLALAGVTDFSAHHFVPEQRSDPHRALAGAPTDALKVLLAHQPRSAPAAAAAGCHVQLSGHTHGGQFVPWIWFVSLQQPYTAGLHRHGDLWVYVSRGTGYWGPPKRLGAPSEVSLVRLVAVSSR